MKLNKKEYNDTGFFQKKYIEEYCNLNIYPKIEPSLVSLIIKRCKQLT